MSKQDEKPSKYDDGQTDMGIQPVRDIRRTISAECDHDPQRLIEYYMNVQEQYSARLLPQRGDDNREDSQRIA